MGLAWLNPGFRETSLRSDQSNLISSIRSASRDMVRELGFMNRHLAGTDLTASQVHALIEIEHAPGLRAVELKALLRLDKSAVSRLVSDLEGRGLVRAQSGRADRRAKSLSLSAQGRAMVGRIHGHAEAQVVEAVQRVPAAGGEVIAHGLRLYADALRGAVSASGTTGESEVTLTAGCLPGAIGDVVALHGRYYAGHGLGARFEALVAEELGEFMRRFDSKYDGFWLARRGGWTLGSVSVDASRRAREGARLRWFIVDPSAHGQGVGRRLVEAALGHCDKMGYRRIYLTTFAGLDAARHLYERHGFRLVSQARDSHWGRAKLEQRFERSRLGRSRAAITKTKEEA
jgi:DNA-binding MarR family transcriptional regulator/GNAT superfamily N-acetyltransferase